MPPQRLHFEGPFPIRRPPGERKRNPDIVNDTATESFVKKKMTEKNVSGCTPSVTAGITKRDRAGKGYLKNLGAAPLRGKFKTRIAKQASKALICLVSRTCQLIGFPE